MNYFSPVARQIIVAGSPQLAALSVGGVVGYPNVLLEQFKANESSIHVDLDTTSWIGSTHGIAGLPSVFMPFVMQRYGRKPAFIISCLIILLGWTVTLIAESTNTILIAEAFHGLGTNSVIVVSFFTISEMVDPKFRIISMSFYAINQTLGIALLGILGKYLHWKTLAYIMSVPMLIALAIGLIWPESPSWFAYKGDYEKCVHSFTWLRGSDDKSMKELMSLINAQKQTKQRKRERLFWKELWGLVRRRDFYVPGFQSFVCLSLFYCSGTIVLLTYGMDIIRTATQNELAAFYGMIVIDIILYLGCLFNALLLRLFRNRPVLLCSGFSSGVCFFFASLVTYLQSVGVLADNSLLCLYCLVGFMTANSLGVASMSFTVAAEVMPVKHRDLGGALYVTLTCVLHFVSLKVSPNLFVYLGLWGTFLVFALNVTAASLYILRFVPETKNRSLQEIEDFYNDGSFGKNKHLDCEETERLEVCDV